MRFVQLTNAGARLWPVHFDDLVATELLFHYRTCCLAMGTTIGPRDLQAVSASVRVVAVERAIPNVHLHLHDFRSYGKHVRAASVCKGASCSGAAW